jgi:hypothetical protein
MIDVSSVTMLGGSITPSRAAIDLLGVSIRRLQTASASRARVNTVTAAVQSMDAIVSSMAPTPAGSHHATIDRVVHHAVSPKRLLAAGSRDRGRTSTANNEDQ